MVANARETCGFFIREVRPAFNDAGALPFIWNCKILPTDQAFRTWMIAVISFFVTMIVVRDVVPVPVDSGAASSIEVFEMREDFDSFG